MQILALICNYSTTLHCNYKSAEILVWKLREFSLTHLWQKFRESNGSTT